MNAISVRAADRSDVPRMSAVARRVFTETYASTTTPADLRRHVRAYFSPAAMSREIERPSVQYLLAYCDAACAGIVKLRENQPPKLLSDASALEIQQLYVSGECQRRGVGRRLVDAALESARERRKDGLWLSVWSKAHWAIRFYVDYGFRSLGEVPFIVGETEYVDFLMWLPTGDEAVQRRDSPQYR